MEKASYLTTPANKLVDMSPEGKLRQLRGKAENNISLLKKVLSGQTEETAETVSEGVDNMINKAQYQYHTEELQKEFSKIEALTREFSLTGEYSAEKLITALNNLVDVIDEML